MRITQCFLLLSLSLSAFAVDEADQPQAISLAQLAAAADLVALAQTRDTDYLRRRGIPVSGSAYLNVLIPYKGARKDEIIEVYEVGLHDFECYFHNPDVFEEGRRYLLFLRKDPDQPERYRGLPQGCAIDVLVRSDNRYAVRLPVTGLRLSDDLPRHARKMTFGDAYALVQDQDLPPTLRDAMLDAGQIEAVRHETGTTDSSAPIDGALPGRQWRYIHGVELGIVRRLMGAENLAH